MEVNWKGPRTFCETYIVLKFNCWLRIHRLWQGANRRLVVMVEQHGIFYALLIVVCSTSFCEYAYISVAIYLFILIIN